MKFLCMMFATMAYYNILINDFFGVNIFYYFFSIIFLPVSIIYKNGSSHRVQSFKFA